MKVDNYLVDKTLSILSSLGFQTFISTGKRSTFDVVAKKGENLILIKILTNVDAFKKEQAASLKCLASKLYASAILVGEKTKTGKLLDGVVYERYGIHVVTPKTLEDSLSGEMPIKKYWKGRIIAKLDSTDLSKLLDKEGIKPIANTLGVSEEAVYMYKKGMGIDISKAKNLNKEYGVNLKPFNILSPPEPERPKIAGYLKDLENLGFEVIPAYSGFDAIAKEKEKLIVAKKTVITKRTTDYLKGAGEFLNGHPLLVSNVKQDAVDRIPVIRESEIKSAKKSKDIIKLVKEREEKQ